MSYIFTGTVVSTDPATFNVIVAAQDNEGDAARQAIFIGGQISSLVGVKETDLPNIGDNVLCIHVDSSTCYALGIIPKPNIHGAKEPFPLRSMFGQGDTAKEKAYTLGYGETLLKTMLMNMGRPTDIVAGEKAFANEFGLLIGMFAQMAIFKASELAQIQAFSDDDLLRIVGHHLEQFTALGSSKVFTDKQHGFFELFWSDNQKEALGIPNSEEIDATGTSLTDTGVIDDGDAPDAIQLEHEGMENIPRVSVFFGAMADIFRLILSKPSPKSMRTNDGTGNGGGDVGLFDVHLSKDGSFFLRTLSVLGIERFGEIKVPVRDVAPELASFTPQPAEVYEWDKSILTEGNPSFFALQLTAFLKHFRNQEYRNFTEEAGILLSDDFDESVEDIKSVSPNNPTDYDYKEETRAGGVYLLPNGGMALRCAWGSAIVLEHGNIYLQPAKDIITLSPRNNIVKVGGYLDVEAHKDISLASAAGALRTKSEKITQVYSKNGGLLFHTDTQTTGEHTPVTGEAVESVGGILFKSDTDIFEYANRKLSRITDSFVLNAESALLHTNRQLDLIGSLINVSAKNSLVLEAKTGLAKLQSVEGSTYVLAGQSAVIAGTNATILGNSDQPLGIEYDEDSPNVDLISGSFDVASNLSPADSLLGKPADVIPNYTTDNSFDQIDFLFLKTEAYKLNLQSDLLPYPLADMSNYPVDSWGTVSEVNGTSPYPGAEHVQSLAAVEITDAGAKLVTKPITEFPKWQT